jgi:hypothetical protein
MLRHCTTLRREADHRREEIFCTVGAALCGRPHGMQAQKRMTIKNRA